MENSEEIRDRLIEKLVNELPVLRARTSASQADIARKIGVSRQTYNSIETGKRKMNWTIFVALIALFKSNGKTEEMIKRIDGFEDDLIKEIDL